MKRGTCDWCTSRRPHARMLFLGGDTWGVWLACRRHQDRFTEIRPPHDPATPTRVLHSSGTGEYQRPTSLAEVRAEFAAFDEEHKRITEWRAQKEATP